MKLKAIEDSGFYGEFYDLVADFRYRIQPRFKAETIVLSEGYWQIRVKEKKFFGTTTIIDFFATIFYENEEHTEYRVMFHIALGDKDSKSSSYITDYMDGKDIISHFRESNYYYIFFSD